MQIKILLNPQCEVEVEGNFPVAQNIENLWSSKAQNLHNSDVLIPAKYFYDNGSSALLELDTFFSNSCVFVR